MWRGEQKRCAPAPRLRPPAPHFCFSHLLWKLRPQHYRLVVRAQHPRHPEARGACSSPPRPHLLLRASPGDPVARSGGRRGSHAALGDDLARALRTATHGSAGAWPASSPGLPGQGNQAACCDLSQREEQVGRARPEQSRLAARAVCTSFRGSRGADPRGAPRRQPGSPEGPALTAPRAPGQSAEL